MLSIVETVYEAVSLLERVYHQPESAERSGWFGCCGAVGVGSW